MYQTSSGTEVNVRRNFIFLDRSLKLLMFLASGVTTGEDPPASTVIVSSSVPHHPAPVVSKCSQCEDSDRRSYTSSSVHVPGHTAYHHTDQGPHAAAQLRQQGRGSLAAPSTGIFSLLLALFLTWKMFILKTRQCCLHERSDGKTAQHQVFTFSTKVTVITISVHITVITINIMEVMAITIRFKVITIGIKVPTNTIIINITAITIRLK